MKNNAVTFLKFTFAILFLLPTVVCARGQNIDLKQYYRDLRGKAKVSKKATYKSVLKVDGKDYVDERHYRVKVLNDNVLFESEEKVICSNRKYSFILKKVDGAWVVSYLGIGDKPDPGFIETCCLEKIYFLTRPHCTFTDIFVFDDLVNENRVSVDKSNAGELDFTLQLSNPVSNLLLNPDGIKALKDVDEDQKKFVISMLDKKYKATAKLHFSESRPAQFDIQYVQGTGFSAVNYKTGKLELKYDDAGDFPSQVTLFQKGPAREHTLTVHFENDNETVNEKSFSLSRYGMPEPAGIVFDEEKKPTNRTAILIAATTALFAVLILLYFKFRAKK